MCLWLRILWCDIYSSLSFIDHHTGAAAFHVTDVALESIINRCGRRTARLAIVCGNAGGLFNGTGWDIATGSFNDDVGTWYTTSMEPDIVGGGLVKGHFFVLPTVLANQYGKAVTAPQMQRYTATRRHRFPFERFSTFAFLRSFLELLLL